MRFETAERKFAQAEGVVQHVIPAKDLGLILDNIGLPSSKYKFAFGDGSCLAYNDRQMPISLNEGHAPTAGVHEGLAQRAASALPRTCCSISRR